MSRILSIAILIASRIVLLAQTPTPCQSRTCAPPPTFTYAAAAVPFNAPVRFGGGTTTWLWIKDGEPPAPCPQSVLNVRVYDRACRARVGDPLYTTMPFVLAAPKPLGFASLSSVSVAAAPGVQLVLFAQLVTPDGSYSANYVGIRIAHPPTDATRFELVRYPEGRAVTFWRENLRLESDGSVILPYHVTGPLGTRRTLVFAIDADGKRAEVLADTRLMDLPICGQQ